MSIPGSEPVGIPPASHGHAPIEAPLFSDGIGDRVVAADPATGELLQVLRINPALTAVPSFEFALRERVARLANFRHPYFARVRRVDRSPSHATALALVSDHVEGTRLSEILRVAEERGLHLDINAALCLVRQLVPAIALLHENARDAAHGLVAPERLIVSPNGRLIVVEHVFGAAVEQMQYGRERLWCEFGVAMPPSAGIPRFDPRADVIGMGVVTLSLVLGRRLRSDEFPRNLADLLNGARERTALGEEQPLGPALRSWLARALQLDLRRAFATAPEALAALDEVTGDGSAYVPAPVALETFLSRYIAAMLTPAVPARPVVRQDAAVVAPAALPTGSLPPVMHQATAPALPVPQAVVEQELRLAPAPVARPEPVPPMPEAAVEPVADPMEPKPLFDPDAPFSITLPPEAPTEPTKGRTALLKWWPAAVAIVVLVLGGYAGLKIFGDAGAPAMATLTVESNPAGVPVFVDGVERGVTPARITLAAGAHILELRRGVPRVIPITLAAGAEVSQYLEFVETPVPTEPVAVAPQQATRPAPAADPPAAPATPAPSAAPLAGWISAQMPFAVEIRENGRLIGTTQADRVMLAAGSHELEFVNEALGYREVRTVQVAAGKVTAVPIEVPKGSVNLNASPWAEVWLDGERLGETPIGNVAVPIGPHEVVFRHPQFGERRHAISVTVTTPVRLSVEMR